MVDKSELRARNRSCNVAIIATVFFKKSLAAPAAGAAATANPTTLHGSGSRKDSRSFDNKFR